MAALAISGCERGPGAGMHRIGGVLPVFQVTGIAGSAQTQEHPRCGLLVALIALHSGVSA